MSLAIYSWFRQLCFWVVICFHFSIFVVLETAESSKSTNTQGIKQIFRIKKQHVSKQKIPL